MLVSLDGHGVISLLPVHTLCSTKFTIASRNLNVASLLGTPTHPLSPYSYYGRWCVARAHQFAVKNILGGWCVQQTIVGTALIKALQARFCGNGGKYSRLPTGKNNTNTRIFQGFSRVGSNLTGRVWSGRVDPTREIFETSRPDPTRPARFSRRLDPTRPDPRDFEIVLTRPDPTRDNPGDPRDSGRLAGHVSLTGDISHGSKSNIHGSKHVYLGRLVGSWSLVLFPVCRLLCVFYRHCLQLMIMSCGVRSRNRKETATHMHGHARTARPPGRPDE